MASICPHVRTKDLSFYERTGFAAEGRARGRVLDFPAGSGADSTILHELGYGVVPADLFPERFRPRLDGVRCVRANLTGRFPFVDESFDYMLHSEANEHLPGQFSVLKECYRVLKPNGHLLITTPNLLSLRGRVALAMTGDRAFKSFVDEHISCRGTTGNRSITDMPFLSITFSFGTCSGTPVFGSRRWSGRTTRNPSCS
jgi:2-polyprenyl-3-methyl-5-hydroxy-6-metoxy-1,4-benzoquinol methylase